MANKKQFTQTIRKRARELANEIYDKSQESTKLTNEVKEHKAELASILNDIQKDSIEIECEDESIGSFTFTVKIVERLTSLVYDVPKLKKNLGKELSNEVIDKVYEISDMSNLIKLLKSHGVQPDEFKKFINVHEVVNNGKLQQLFSVGEITTKQIEGTYTAKLSKSIQVRKKG